jgi:hypothetical protein
MLGKRNNMNKIDKQYLDNALSYGEYLNLTRQLVDDKKTSGNEQSDEKIQFTALNLQRMSRLNKTAVITDEVKLLIGKIKQLINILVISETWCGDAAQQLPWLAKIAELNKLISLKIVLRDDNQDLMNQYLTNGNQSIPVTLFIDDENNEKAKLTIRPSELIILFKHWTEQGLKKEEKILNVHNWYSKNKGINLQSDIANILSKRIIQ